jgi:cytidine deaminase
MNTLNIESKFRIVHTSELSSDMVLLNEAVKAQENAYAPYSEFRVGASLRLEDGTILRASNQENSAYPSGLCAERVLLFYTGANHPGKVIETLFISCEHIAGICAPCGSCRQVISQSESRQDKPIRIYFPYDSDYYLLAESITDLLPFPFKLRNV